MTPSFDPVLSPILLIVAGAKGAVASTLAAAVAALQQNPNPILSSLTTAQKFSYLGPPQNIRMAGWDKRRNSLVESIIGHGVLPEHIRKPLDPELDRMDIRDVPVSSMDPKAQIKQLIRDIGLFKSAYPRCRPVFINLLPAAVYQDLNGCRTWSQLFSKLSPQDFPDMVFSLAALRCGLPMINFTSNEVEIPLVLRDARKRGVPLCGRDGKTGQTYLKVVLASALKARNLFIDGWYSLNILGNADGANLMEPGHGEGKLKNKTEILDEILGYRVGDRYTSASHKVLIDYYPPRGDAKEAWDVIDFLGLFDLPMSLRLNLQGRDSILAAPLVLDLARWMAAVQLTGKSGPIPELGFFFKRPVGDDPPLTYEDQLRSLSNLEQDCDRVHG
jgi:myo-inositol-1-phosphate synthase